MSSTPTLYPGGAIVALTTTETTVDLTNLQGLEIYLWCDEQDVLFSASNNATGNVLISTASPASSTALIADRVAAGIKISRMVGTAKYLVAKTVMLTGTLRIKVIGSGFTAGDLGKLPLHLLPTS